MSSSQSQLPRKLPKRKSRFKRSDGSTSSDTTSSFIKRQVNKRPQNHFVGFSRSLIYACMHVLSGDVMCCFIGWLSHQRGQNGKCGSSSAKRLRLSGCEDALCCLVGLSVAVLLFCRCELKAPLCIIYVLCLPNLWIFLLLHFHPPWFQFLRCPAECSKVLAGGRQAGSVSHQHQNPSTAQFF